MPPLKKAARSLKKVKAPALSTEIALVASLDVADVDGDLWLNRLLRLRGKNTRNEDGRNDRDDGTGDKPGTGGAVRKYSKTVNGQGITWAHLRRE
ncbi:MAG: hypothetical protein DMG13_34740 [Acidobacteria bacterium]|nr:MAG: hypothetical protein DMG13_34740 [Acidobacteriota bacterium]